VDDEDSVPTGGAQRPKQVLRGTVGGSIGRWEDDSFHARVRVLGTIYECKMNELEGALEVYK